MGIRFQKFERDPSCIPRGADQGGEISTFVILGEGLIETAPRTALTGKRVRALNAIVLQSASRACDISSMKPVSLLSSNITV